MKAILVIEMPSKCRDCQFYYQTHDESDDYVSKCEVLNDMTIDGFIDKYSGCPLKPMIEKKSDGETLKVAIENDCYDGTTEDKAYFAGYDKGYNACIDEILGDKE